MALIFKKYDTDLMKEINKNPKLVIKQFNSIIF